jgi:DNA-binding transcriptional ArsR family regulator
VTELDEPIPVGASWRLLTVFSIQVRVELVKLLLEYEMATLSDIARKLSERDLQITLPGLFKHMRILEEAGIVRRMSGGIVLDVPDARKTVYLLEGKERVKAILQQLENNVSKPLAAGEIFNRTSKVARKVQEMRPNLVVEEKKRLETLITLCESEEVHNFLTEDEKKKVKLWRIMLTF